jgi:hypothetical protein
MVRSRHVFRYIPENVRTCTYGWSPGGLPFCLMGLALAPLIVGVAALHADPVNSLDAGAIISRSIVANESDWMADPLYDRCERDDDGGDVQTYDVTMMGGQPYERLVALNDQPLSPSRAQDEQNKRQREMARRRLEDVTAGAPRDSSYRRRHARFKALFQQFPNAFTFTLEGPRRMAGRTAYYVTAAPRPEYEPPTRDARALTAMTVEFWVDVETYHWIKLAARITKPVSLVGLLVRLEPGTTVELEKAPVGGSQDWLVTRLRFQSTSRLLMLFGHHTSSDEQYFNFRRSSKHIESFCDAVAP